MIYSGGSNRVIPAIRFFFGGDGGSFWMFLWRLNTLYSLLVPCAQDLESRISDQKTDGGGTGVKGWR